MQRCLLTAGQKLPRLQRVRAPGCVQFLGEEKRFTQPGPKADHQ
jgi:hypothetical protein